MISAFRLIFTPLKEWERIAEANRGIAWILLTYLLPLVLVSSGFELYGLTTWGERHSEYGQSAPVRMEVALKYQVVHVGLVLLIMMIGAKALQAVAQSFHVMASYTQSFTAVAYGLGPIFLAQILDAAPVLPTWLCFAIGMVLTAGLLYNGVALCLRPEQTKGFGLYVFTVVFLGVGSGLAHFTSLMVLRERLWA